MKKFKLVLVLIGAVTLSAQFSPVSAAGRDSFNKGDFIIGPAVGTFFGVTGLTVPVSLNAEFGVSRNIGIGLFAGYIGYSFAVLGTSYSWAVIPVGVTGMYHFDLGNPKLDLGLGFAVGYNIFVASSTLSSITSYLGGASWLAWGVFGNIRYYLNKNIALKGRLGYGISIVEVGIDFRL